MVFCKLGFGVDDGVFGLKNPRPFGGLVNVSLGLTDVNTNGRDSIVSAFPHKGDAHRCVEPSGIDDKRVLHAELAVWHGWFERPGSVGFVTSVNAADEKADVMLCKNFRVEVWAAPELIVRFEVFGVASHIVDHDKEADGVDPVAVLRDERSANLSEGVLKHFGPGEPVLVKNFPVGSIGLEFVEEKFDLPVLNEFVGIAFENVLGDFVEKLFWVGDSFKHLSFLVLVGATDGSVESGAVEFSLTAEVIIDQREVDSGFGGDFTDRNGGESQVGKEFPGGLDESVFRVGWAEMVKVCGCRDHGNVPDSDYTTV